MALEIRAKAALVTGGAAGIGLAISRQLRAGGCNVVIADLALTSEVQELLEPHGEAQTRVSFVETDVTLWHQLERAFGHALDEFGRLDIVIPCAGIFEPVGVSNFWCPFQGQDTTQASSFKQLDVNIGHPARATQLAIDSFLRQKLGHGVVVHMSSIAAQVPIFQTPLYAAGKHAISGLVRSLAQLEPRFNIRVNAVAPGLVKTAFWSQDKLQHVPQGFDIKWTTPDQVAHAILGLITNEQYVGGTVLEIGPDGSLRTVNAIDDPGPFLAVERAYDDIDELIRQNFGR